MEQQVTEPVIEVVDKKEEQVNPMDVINEQVSTLLFTYTPRFQVMIDQLPLKALRRVMKKLVAYPLTEKEFKAMSDKEKEVFNLGNRLLEGKYVLIMNTLANEQAVQEAINQVQKQAAEVSTQEVVSDNSSKEGNNEN